MLKYLGHHFLLLKLNECDFPDNLTQNLCYPAPEVPAIGQAYSKHSDSITVEFTEVSGATSYILRAESDSGDFFSETVVSSSPGTVLQLQPYTIYRMSVMSVNRGGRSQPSYPIQARTGNSYANKRLYCTLTLEKFSNLKTKWRTDTFD